MFSRAMLVVSLFLPCTLVCGSSRAAPVAITNAGFESDLLAAGSLSHTITGWLATSGGGDGVFHPTASEYATGVPEGQNVAYVNLTGNFVRQVLSATLQADTIYRLQVEVGQRLDTGFTGYSVQLLAGGVVLAEDDDSLAPAPGQFLTSTVTYFATSSEPQLGQPLEIKLLSKGVQTKNDDVRLEAVAVGGPADVCAPGSQVIDLRTGVDADSDGLDDNWTVISSGAGIPEAAAVFHPAFAAWRGSVQTAGPFHTGARYPVLGDGRWITNAAALGDAVYERQFTLDGSCAWPVLSLEVDADDFIELELNGNVVFSSLGTPPAPWLSNPSGIFHPDADPDDGLLHPSCDAPVFRCTNTEDNFREIHPVIVDGPVSLDIDGENTLTARVLDQGVITGFLVTGGAQTSILSGATVRCCVPERPQAAVAGIFADGFESGNTSAWSGQEP